MTDKFANQIITKPDLEMAQIITIIQVILSVFSFALLFIDLGNFYTQNPITIRLGFTLISLFRIVPLIFLYQYLSSFEAESMRKILLVNIILYVAIILLGLIISIPPIMSSPAIYIIPTIITLLTFISLIIHMVIAILLMSMENDRVGGLYLVGVSILVSFVALLIMRIATYQSLILLILDIPILNKIEQIHIIQFAQGIVLLANLICGYALYNMYNMAINYNKNPYR